MVYGCRISQINRIKMQVNFENVSKNYGLITALKEVDIKIDQGDFIFIAGPSGSGKSTLLKLILNQIKPSEGSITIDGIDLSKATKDEIDRIRRQTGVIFQDYQLVSDKTVEENVSLALDIVNFPLSQIPSRVDEVIEMVGLSSRRFLFPSQLSGGEMQRASLARALAVKPKLILADEPTGNLDTQNSWYLVKLLKDINKDQKTTIIMTTHNQDIIDSFDKRVIYLKMGQVENERR